MEQKIRHALAQTSRFLISRQRRDGSWAMAGKIEKVPITYQKPLILTAQVTNALIYAGLLEAIPAIKKGLFYCLNCKTDPEDDVDLWSWRLQALKFSNTPRSKAEREKILDFILKKQSSGGFWPSFPKPTVMSNFSIVCAVVDYAAKGSLDKAVGWFRKIKVGQGWGYDASAKKPEISFTANATLALITAGMEPSSPELQDAVEFLEKRQNKDGGWSMSSLTIADVSTTYSTAICALSLMLLAEDPFNERVEKAISFLLASQLASGQWPRFVGDKKIHYYPVYYVTKMLAFWLYLKEKWNSAEGRQLRRWLKPQQVAVHFFNQFEREVQHNLDRANLEAVLSSRAIGATQKARARRLAIIQILADEGQLDVADIIDALKKIKQYAYLNKKAHMTQIKYDLSYLKSINLLSQINNEYYVVSKI